MNLFRWPTRVLPALLLCTALAGGSGPAQTVFPQLRLDTSLLQVGPPHVSIVPSRTVADQNYFYPAYLDVRFSRSPMLPRFKVTQAASVLSGFYLQRPQVQLQVLSVPALLTASRGYGNRLELRKSIKALRAINAETLNPATLIPPGGHAPKYPALGLPYLMPDGLFQATAGALKKLVLPGGIRGIRYLVIRAGDTGYLPAEMVEYTFQGLSADGKFYVTLRAPYMPAGVLSEAQINRAYTRAQQQSSVEATFDAYALTVERQMDANNDAPKVRLLDALVNSIRLR